MLANRRLVVPCLLVCSAGLFVAISGALAQAQQPAPPATTTDEPNPAGAAPDEKSQDEPITEADRIARLQSTIAADEKALTELRAQLEKRGSEEDVAGTEFQKVIAQIESLTQQLQNAEDDGDQAAATQIEEKLKPLQKERELAKEKFDLSIAARKTAHEQVTTLEAKTAQDKQALDKLKGIGPPPTETKPQAPTTPTVPDAGQPTAPAAPATKTAKPAEETKAPETQAEREARRDVEKKEKALADLEQDVEKLTESKSLLEQNIALESQTLETARKQYDNLEKELDTAETTFGERLAAGTPADELQQLRQRVSETQQQLRASRTAIRESTDRLQALRNQLLALQSEETALIKQTEELRQQAEAAKRSEFYVNVQQYVFSTGPKLLATLVVMFILWAVVKLICARAKKWIERDATGTRAERKHRSQTLIGVFQNTGNLAIVVGGLLMMLDAAGVPIAPLLGGAGVVGLAVAFAAQSLIKDYFCGFILLLENQFKLGDVITINDITGTVERITLRITVLRNVDGHVFYVPNGQITAVKNSTTEWARVVLDVGVAYKEQIDQVIDVLLEIAAELKSDAAFSEFVLGEPEMFGVDALADSSVVVKLGLKVQPDKQWAIKRELLRRIKGRFDELGIEIPFPQQTVHHRMENGEAVPMPAQRPLGEHHS
jgi:small-conductance mechanosensitive channel/predicted  nucleic acid-binding Zn-ribbon protein